VSDGDGGPTFEQFLDTAEWSHFEQYIEVSQGVLRSEIRKHVSSERDIRKKLRARVTTTHKDRLRYVHDAALARGRDRLVKDTVAIDGTQAQVAMLSGIRGQLGVVAMRYSGEMTSYVSYVTEVTYSDFDPDADIEEIVARRNKDEYAVSPLVVRAMLAYNERQRALEQPQKWCILQGELFPFELRSGLGKLKCLDVSLDLFTKIAQRKTIGAVVSDTTSPDINYGFALEPREYFRITDLRYEYEKWLDGGAKFNPDDKAKFGDFARDVGGQILKGVFRVGQRPFLFYAHEDAFDDFAAIVVADALHIPERGFPLLIDYADSVCASLFRAGDFERRVNYELALEGDLLSEQSERASRAR
jgi:hypothetical protein